MSSEKTKIQSFVAGIDLGGKALTDIHRDYLKESGSSITYASFYYHVKSLVPKKGGPRVGRVRKPSSKREAVVAFIRNSSYPSVAEAYRNFSEVKCSYPYFLGIYKEVNDPNIQNCSDKYISVEDFLKGKEFKSIAAAHRDYSDTVRKISYVTFWAAAKDVFGKPVETIKEVKKGGRSSPRKDALLEFLSSCGKFSAIGEAYKAYTKAVSDPVTYQYFTLLVKKDNVDLLTKKCEDWGAHVHEAIDLVFKERFKGKMSEGDFLEYLGSFKFKARLTKRGKVFVVPQNIDDIYRDWDKFILKNIGKTLQRVFSISNPELVKEIRQEVYLDLCNYFKAERYNESKSTFTSYLFNIVKNCTVRYISKQNKNPAVRGLSLSEVVSEDGDGDRTLMDVLDSGDSGYFEPNYDSEDVIGERMFVKSFMEFLRGKEDIVEDSPESTLTYVKLYRLIEDGFPLSEVARNTNTEHSKVIFYKKKLTRLYRDFERRMVV